MSNAFPRTYSEGQGHRQLGWWAARKPPEESLRAVEAGRDGCREARKHSKELKGEASRRDPGVLRIARMIFGTSSVHFGNS